MTAAGIDVGGPRKGFHAVVLGPGGRLERFRSTDAEATAAWVRRTGAEAAGVDAPCRWSPDGRMRAAERELARRGLSCFATPTRERAEGHPFYAWMRNGMLLYERLAPDYPLFGGPVGASGRTRVCFETFPHAVACALAGRRLSARDKRRDRRALLEAELGREAAAELGPIDFLDAALCALAARRLLLGAGEAIGDGPGGLIVLPAAPGPGGADRRPAAAASGPARPDFPAGPSTAIL